MALQDLTPQLRTRLNRMERAVGWFVTLAVLALVAGFAYYLYSTAKLKGWFITKAPFYTYVDRATGLKVGDGVTMMGFEVGKVTRIEPMPTHSAYNVFVEFEVKHPYYGYLWTEGSRALINIADLLGKRTIEVTKGTNGYAIYTTDSLRQVGVEEARGLDELVKWQLAQELRKPNPTNSANFDVVFRAKTSLTNLADFEKAGFTNFLVMDTREKHKNFTGIWNLQTARYESYTRESKYELVAEESAAVTERLEALVKQVEDALPAFLDLTNQLTTVLDNAVVLTSNLNATVVGFQPVARNLSAVTAGLDRPGALGQLLLTPAANAQLEGTLTNAHATLEAANTNLAALAQSLEGSLDNLAGITSNLNHQVAINTNLVSSISQTIIHADEFIQGLKHFWLLRSAFKTRSTNAPPHAPVRPMRAPKEKGEQ